MKQLSIHECNAVSAGELQAANAIGLISAFAVFGIASGYVNAQEGYEISYSIAGYLVGTLVGILSTACFA